jgi:hypothetical protein
MKLEVTVSEIADIFKEIQERLGQLFEMIRLDIREVVGKYLTTMMNAELTHFLGREPYVRVAEAVNHRNGSYGRGFTLKGSAKSMWIFPGIVTENSRPPSFPGVSSMKRKWLGISAFCF